MLTVNNISFSYVNRRNILNDISFKLSAGEVLSVVGASGAGKSTLLKCIAGLLQLEKGEIQLEGERVKGPKDQLIAGNDEIAYVTQVFSEDEYYTTEENIRKHLLHLTESVRDKFIEELIKLLDLDLVRNQKAGKLSGGEQQRLSMACALAKEPKVILLDEPFAHLDVHLRKKVGRYLKTLCQKNGVSVLLVTHEGEEALSWSSKILFINKGKIIRKYTPENAYLNPKTLKEGRYFGELNSVNIDGKQLLFRPTQYNLDGKGSEIDLKYLFSEFRGAHFANFFKLLNGKEVILYANKELKELKQIYVQKEN